MEKTTGAPRKNFSRPLSVGDVRQSPRVNASQRSLSPDTQHSIRTVNLLFHSPSFATVLLDPKYSQTLGAKLTDLKIYISKKGSAQPTVHDPLSLCFIVYLKEILR